MSMIKNIKLPYSEELELEVLSCLAFNPNEDILNIALEIDSSDFYFPKHQEILATIKNLQKDRIQIDAVTIVDDLKSRDMLAKVGGEEYILCRVTSKIPSPSKLETYVKRLKRYSRLRKIISACIDCIGTASSSSISDFEENVDNISKVLFDAIDIETKNDNCVHASEALSFTYDELQQIYTGDKSTQVIKTGFCDVDNILTGLWSGDLIIIAGRPSMGKSALGLQIAQNVAKSGRPAILFSIEMSNLLLSTRIFAMETRTSSQLIRSAKISSKTWADMANICDEYREFPLHLDDSPIINVNYIRSKCRSIYKKYKDIGLFVVDYLQLTKALSKKQNREQEVAEISKALKALAKEFNVPGIVLSQLNRSVEMRGDKRPMLSDLRESGAIEQDADVVWMIYRDEYYHKETSDAGIAEHIICKNRSGATGVAKTAFLNEFTLFQNLERRFDIPEDYID